MSGIIHLSRKPVYEFSTPVFSGIIRPYGHLHGLVITNDAEGRLVTSPGKCFMNLEHYEAKDRQGLFVPRDLCQHSSNIGDGWLAIHFAKTNNWRVESQVRYWFISDDTIDIEFEFLFDEDLESFEGFIASYMVPGTLPPWIKINGQWTRPEINNEVKEQLFIPKDKKALKVVEDGRWQILYDRGNAYRAIRQYYDLPVMVTTRDNDLSTPVIIQMVNPKLCFALSPNRFAPAHDFSIVGRKVTNGETIIAKARLVYRKIDRLNDVELIYQDFLASL